MFIKSMFSRLGHSYLRLNLYRFKVLTGMVTTGTLVGACAGATAEVTNVLKCDNDQKDRDLFQKAADASVPIIMGSQIGLAAGSVTGMAVALPEVTMPLLYLYSHSSVKSCDFDTKVNVNVDSDGLGIKSEVEFKSDCIKKFK